MHGPDVGHQNSAVDADALRLSQLVELLRRRVLVGRRRDVKLDIVAAADVVLGRSIALRTSAEALLVHEFAHSLLFEVAAGSKHAEHARDSEEQDSAEG